MAEKQRMIFVFSSWLLYNLITVFSVCNGERRIVGGSDVTAKHSYVVYLIKAERSQQSFPGWLCGGTLVKRRLAITSAACVRDIYHMYLIAGYNRYVPDDQRKIDKCISKMKRKVINICIPTDYILNHHNTSVWSRLDIAVVKTDADVTGVEDYREHCHYVPRSIEVNFKDEKLQDTGQVAVILGWGHKKEYRQDKDLTDYNSKILQYAATKIFDKKKCLENYYDSNFNSYSVLKNFVICTWPSASFNDKGKDVLSDNEKSDELDIKELKEGCSEADEKKHNEKSSHTSKSNDVGICQNDHGGPLISWQSKKPILIGVASVFKLSNFKCEGPFLFTSTYCSSRFLKCVMKALADKPGKGARRSMNRPGYFKLPPGEKEFNVIERRISWLNHPDGPAETEKCQLQPQKPVQDNLRR